MTLAKSGKLNIKALANTPRRTMKLNEKSQKLFVSASFTQFVSAYFTQFVSASPPKLYEPICDFIVEIV